MVFVLVNLLLKFQAQLKLPRSVLLALEVLRRLYNSRKDVDDALLLSHLQVGELALLLFLERALSHAALLLDLVL